MKVLLIDRFPQAFLQELQALPISVHYHPDSQRDSILPMLRDTDILIMNSKIRMDKEAAELAPKLKLVVRAGVGMDHIDVDYLAEKGIKALNTQGQNANAVGEQTVGMLLAMRHNLIRANAQVKQFVWSREENRGRELRDKTVGIIGYGYTGKSVAQKLSGFGCSVLAYDKYLEGYGDEYAEAASLEQIQAEAEVLSMHVPLTPETRGWVNSDFISAFAHPFMLLNLARGPIVHIPSVLEGLEKGKLISVALDVLPNEKLHTLSEGDKHLYQRLFAHERVMLSPHIGGWTHESLANINGRILAYVKEELG